MNEHFRFSFFVIIVPTVLLQLYFYQYCIWLTMFTIRSFFFPRTTFWLNIKEIASKKQIKTIQDFCCSAAIVPFLFEAQKHWSQSKRYLLSHRKPAYPIQQHDRIMLVILTFLTLLIFKGEKYMGSKRIRNKMLKNCKILNDAPELIRVETGSAFLVGSRYAVADGQCTCISQVHQAQPAGNRERLQSPPYHIRLILCSICYPRKFERHTELSLCEALFI